MNEPVTEAAVQPVAAAVENESPENQKLKCSTLVVKVASRCNLNCSYCYMYNLGDETYRNQPKVMSRKTLRKTVDRAYEHCVDNNLRVFIFIFHGGEPLLAGKEFFKEFTSYAREKFSNIKIKLLFAMQTNATLLTPDWADFLGECDISLGISLDGVKEVNDMHRVDHAGKGSYDRIIEGIRNAQASEKMVYKPAVLSVINLKANPEETYHHVKSLNVPGVSFLLPDGNYDKLSLLREGYNSETPYADWLIKIFDLWYNDNKEKNKFDIDMFTGFIKGLLGGRVPSDAGGNDNNDVLVIETNGGIEAVDVLKTCGHGFTKAGATVFSHSFDEAMETPLAKMYLTSNWKTCNQCRLCPISNICGSGYLPHRYSSENGFNNPSIYCLDYLKLITHIQNRVVDDLPEQVKQESEVEKLTYEEARELLNEAIAEAAVLDNPYAAEMESFAKKSNELVAV
ncbi:MAG: radical SAM protein [Dinghuibacter sp.]|nr:radical SAM protein [Dinghuibacter sp.]